MWRCRSSLGFHKAFEVAGSTIRAWLELEYKKFCSKLDNFLGLIDYVPPILKGPLEHFEKLQLYRVRGQFAK